MTIPHALLALLAPEAKFGLRLKEEFEARTGAIWPLNVGQVYATLGRLERDGLVEYRGGSDDAPSQKLYELTGAGFEELRRWLHTPSVDGRPPRDEVVIKVMVALTVPGVDVGEVIQSHRRQTLEVMQAYTRTKADAAGDLAATMVIDAELLRLEAAVRWLDTCEARLRRGATLDTPEPVPDSGSAAPAKSETIR